VTGYVSDRTQGPACSIACGPATVYRNYFLPLTRDGRHAPSQAKEGVAQEGQTRDLQLNNLIDVSEALGNVPEGRYFEIRNGYTLASSATLTALNRVIGRSSPEEIDRVRAALRVGIHSDSVVTSTNWGKKIIKSPDQLVTQVFSSACAVAYNKATTKEDWHPFASLILEAAFEATILAALLNKVEHEGAHGSGRVYLTCLGGGAFGNTMEWIAQAMKRAFLLHSDYDLDVRIVSLPGQPDHLLKELEKEFSGREQAAEGT